MSRFLMVLVLCACRSEGVIETVEEDPSDTSAQDTGKLADTDGPLEEALLWCLDFESGDLSDIGYDASQVTLGNDALLATVSQGDNFSALTGEERIEFRGEHALLMRAYPLVQPALLAVASTPFFLVEEADFSWFQLSEVGEGGIWLAVDVMAPDGLVLGSLEIPVETGGHLAGLPPDFSPIEGLNDVVVGEGFPGSFVGQRVDLGPFVGQSVSLRFYQYSLVADNAFFSLFDDLCMGINAEVAAMDVMTFEDAQDWGF